MSVCNKSVDSLQHMLRDLRGQVDSIHLVFFIRGIPGDIQDRPLVQVSPSGL